VDRRVPPLHGPALPLADLPRALAAVRAMTPDAPVHFRAASPLVPAAPEVAAYALAQTRPGMTALAAVTALGQALHRDMRYDPAATEVDTPMAEAFAARHGVCQDFSHIMIAGLRGLGIPAGYVSGLLRTAPPPGRPRLEGADAMHAWVRAWCGPQAGWVEYDPTNAVFAGENHIVVARGRDYSDVSPIKGVLRVSGSQSGRHSVDVKPLTD
jgi:transglutaminase-like putative cysteine protease